MEEIATNENKETDLPGDVKLPENKKEDKERENSDDKVDQTVTTPAAMAEGKQPQKPVDTAVANSVDNADSVNQLGNQAINVTVTIDETNQGTFDQEKEKCEPINNDDKAIPHTGEGVMPNDSSVHQMGDTVETSNENLEKKEQESKGDSGEQLDKDDNAEVAVPSEEVVKVAPTEVSAQVISDDSPEKDDSKTDVPSEKAEEVSTSESSPSAQIIDESPGDNGKAEVPSEGMTEVASTESQSSTQIANKETPEGDPEKTEAPPEGTEITVPETQASEQLNDKESTREGENENTTNGEVEPPVANQELQRKEEESPVSAETNEVTETKPETAVGDEAGAEEIQPGGKDQDDMDKTEKDIPVEGSPSQTTWYTDDEGNQQQEVEGYSTAVVGGVVMRKPLPSISSEPKKPAKGSSTGSMSKILGSIFGRKKSVKDKPDMAQPAATETPVHDGTDGVQEPKDSDRKESSTPEDTTVKEASQVAAEPSEATTAEKQQENEVEVPEEEEKDDIVEGAIVPLEEGVADEEEKTTKVVDEAPEQDEQKDDVESPTDEDSLLRERIAKRESGTPSHSPAKHMQMRMSYAEGTKEVEVIGTREAPLQHKKDKQKTSKDNRLSCRELGEVDHEGWLTKRGGGAIFASWKRKWVVLKEQHVYYYKTAFDPEAGGVVNMKDHTITAAPEMKKKFCFKIEAEDPKASKLFFAADNQEDMDKWISVLTSASRGEVIVRKTQNQQSDDVTMRKKTNSMGKRAGSVLGLGGYYTYDGELEKTDQNRRASFGSSPKEAAKNIKPVDKSDDKDRSESPTDDATPSDIQKLMTIKTEGDSVDAPVAMETSPTPPLQEESCSPEVTDTVASEADSKEQNPSNIEADVKISSSEIPKEECPPEIVPLEKTMATPETSQSETKESSGEQKDTHVATPSEEPSQPTDLSNTTWFYVLDDENNDWIDVDEQKAKALKRDSDELLSLVRTIKDARISIIGTPLPGNEERARAMTHVSKQNEEVLKLREMRRSLKDKQRDLMAMEELLTKEVNRHSIHEWKTRYSYLTPEEDRIDENEVTDKENGSSDEISKINGPGIQGGEVGDGEVTDGKVGEKKLDDGADVQEVRSEEGGKAENGIPEHDGEVRSGGEDQDTKPKDSDEAQKGGESGDVAESRDDTSEVAGNVQEDGNGGKDQDTRPEDSDEAQKDGNSGGGKPGDGGESEDPKNVQDDGNGGESPQDSKLEESADVSTNTKDDANEIRLANEDVDEKKTADEVTKHEDEAGESVEQAKQEEPNNNSGTNKSQLPDQSVEEPQKNDEEKDTSETLPSQDQDSINTRL